MSKHRPIPEHPRVLVCPLDWGLGHATRCIPIIKELLKNGCEVVIAADNRPLKLLQKEFPELKTVRFKGYDISYPSNSFMAVKMFMQLPKVFRNILKENRKLQKLVKEEQIDLVISDNRFGAYTRKVPCVFITHQIRIKCPSWLYILEPIMYRINLRYIKKFDYCWIPDFPGSINLSGDLSHSWPLPKTATFIGPLSRFQRRADTVERKYDYMAVVSGPEPQRGIFHDILLKELGSTEKSVLIVSGTPDEKVGDVKGNITIVPHLESDAMENAFLASEVIICRPGYSSIMDLFILKKKAFFIPTPGQTEQEYLAKEFSAQKLFPFKKQTDFTSQWLEENHAHKGFSETDAPHDQDLLSIEVQALLRN